MPKVGRKGYNKKITVTIHCIKIHEFESSHETNLASLIRVVWPTFPSTMNYVNFWQNMVMSSFVWFCVQVTVGVVHRGSYSLWLLDINCVFEGHRCGSKNIIKLIFHGRYILICWTAKEIGIYSWAMLHIFSHKYILLFQIENIYTRWPTNLKKKKSKPLNYTKEYMYVFHYKCTITNQQYDLGIPVMQNGEKVFLRQFQLSIILLLMLRTCFKL